MESARAYGARQENARKMLFHIYKIITEKQRENGKAESTLRFFPWIKPKQFSMAKMM